MAVEYIEYNGEKLPVKVGYYVLKMMQSEHGADMTDVTKQLALNEPMLYYALKQGHKLEKKKFTYKMSDMVDILDDCFWDFQAIASEFFPTELMEKLTGEVGMKEK